MGLLIPHFVAICFRMSVVLADNLDRSGGDDRGVYFLRRMSVVGILVALCLSN